MQHPNNIKIIRLAEAVLIELQKRQHGHCIRIDHLELEECRQACSLLQKLSGKDIHSFVLAETQDSLHIPVDRAIELRNRKAGRLCIFVPANLQDVAVSSLGNAFSSFPLKSFLKKTAEDLRAELDPSIEPYVANVISQLRSSTRVSIERLIDYLASVKNEGSFESVGQNLWRIGLIPDLRTDVFDFARAVELNRICVERMVHPVKPQSGLSERITSLKLKPNTIQTALSKFLEGRRLTSDDSWLSDLLNHTNLTFDRWEFPDVIPSDLEGVEIEPFYEGGRLRPGTGLKQEAPGTTPYAPCGPKQKMKLRWLPEPGRPRNVSEWLVEMVPNPEDYPTLEPDVIDLPKKRVRGSASSATLSLDISDEILEEVRSVLVRVTALDEVGLEVRNAHTGETVSDVSQAFYLEDSEDTTIASTKRLSTDRCLADAYLKVAMQSRDGELHHVSLEPLEKDLLYCPVQINDRYVSRMATSRFLLELEHETINSSATPLFFVVNASDEAPVTRDQATSQPCDLTGLIDDKMWKEFITARRKFFDHFKSQGCNAISTLHFNKEVCDSVVRIARAYCAICDEILSFCDSDPIRFNDAVKLLTSMDTLDVHFHGGTRSNHITVHLATHPARLLWLAAYSEWIHSVATTLLQSPVKLRKKLFDPAMLQNIAPDNIPTFIARPNLQASVFADNLQFIYGVSLPIDTADTASLFSETAWVLGLGEPDSRLTVIEGPRLSDQVRRYRSLRPFTTCLRVAAVNTGNGNFLTAALQDALRPRDVDSVNEPVPHLDLIHCLRKDDPIPRSEAERFLAEWQRSSISKRGDQLRPSVQVALNRLDLEKGLPGGNVHITTMLDGHCTSLVMHNPLERQRESKQYSAGSLGLFGLITKLESEFVSNGVDASWWHRLVLNGPQNAGEHPVRPIYTRLIQDLHDRHLTVTGAVLSGKSSSDTVPMLRTVISNEGMNIMNFFHDSSDWVLSIDRHFGIEYFDSPTDEHLCDTSEKYLLDYAPEFVDGFGHRQIMTTNWIDEVSQIMHGAMEQLGISGDKSNCKRLLSILKSLSGRLVLRLATEDSLAQETVGLAIAMAHLQSAGELSDAIVVPLDAHKDFFLQAKKNNVIDSASRCDLLIIRGLKNRLRIDFVEIKSRHGLISPSEDLLDKIADQTHRTDHLFRSMFFNEEPKLDQSVLLCHLASVLRFYLKRALRHGRLSSQESFDSLMDMIGRIETGQAKLSSRHRGIIINIGGSARRDLSHKGTNISFLTGPDIERSAGVALSKMPTQQSSENEQSTLGEEASVTVDAEFISKNLTDTLPTTTVSQAVVDDESNELHIRLGLDQHTGEPIDYISSVAGSPHMFILGIPGQGKSWTMQRVVSESAKQNVPAIILDYHGQFANLFNRSSTSIKPIICDASLGLPFSPFEANMVPGPRDWKTNAFQIAEIVQQVCGLGEMQRDVVYEAVRDAYIASGFDSDGKSLPSMNDVFTQLQRRELDRKGTRNVTARCRPLFEFNLFSDDKDTEFTFADAYKAGLVVDLHSLGLEVLQNAAGSFVLKKLYKDMFSWGESERIRLLVVLDEAHRLSKDVTLPKLMKEGRKFGLAVVVASQSIQDFHPDVLENAGTKVAYRLNHPQNRLASGFFKVRDHGDDVASVLSSLLVGQALVQTPLMHFAKKTFMSPLDSENGGTVH